MTEVRTNVETVAFTTTRRVSGGEVAIQARPDGRQVFWMNGHRVDRATVARKLGH